MQIWVLCKFLSPSAPTRILKLFHIIPAKTERNPLALLCHLISCVVKCPGLNQHNSARRQMIDRMV